MRVVECERAREYSSARGLACNAREYYTITTRVTCESLASHSRVSRESLASDTRVPFNLLVDSTVARAVKLKLATWNGWSLAVGSWLQNRTDLDNTDLGVEVWVGQVEEGGGCIHLEYPPIVDV